MSTKMLIRKTHLIKVGNSLAVIVPFDYSTQRGLAKGDEVALWKDTKGNLIVIPTEE